MDAGGLAFWAQHMDIWICYGHLDLLKIGQAVQINVSLKQVSIWDVSRNCIELQCLNRLVQLQEAILGSMKRAPDMVEARSRCR